MAEKIAGPNRGLTRGNAMAISSIKTVPIIVAFVAGVTIGYFASSVPSGSDGMSGTVAPAERYRAVQPTRDDIKLGDQALVDLMQSDVFIAVMSDSDMASTLSDARMRSLFANANFTGMLGSAELQALFGNAELQALLDNAEFRGLLDNAEFRGLLDNAEFQGLLANAEFRALHRYRR